MSRPKQSAATNPSFIFTWDSATNKWLAADGTVLVSNDLVPAAYDYVALTYVSVGNGAGEIETATYKTGGAAGTTVATLTLAYDSSNRISSVTKT